MNDCIRQALLMSAYTSRDCRGEELTQRTFIAREFAFRASAIVGIPADTADIVIGHVPTPGGDGVPFSYRDLHCVALELWS
jgi:hypothetical protein